MNRSFRKSFKIVDEFGVEQKGFGSLALPEFATLARFKVVKFDDFNAITSRSDVPWTE